MSKVGSAHPNGNQAGRVLRWRLLRTRRPGVDIISGASLDQKNKCIPGRSSILMPQEDTGLRRACTSHDLLSRRLSLLKPGSPIGESDRSRPCCPGLALATFSLPLGTHPSLNTRDAVAARAPNAPSWKQCRPEPINGLARRRRRECLANGNAIRGSCKPRGSPCSISDRVEDCGAACSGVSGITHVRTGGTNGNVRQPARR